MKIVFVCHGNICRSAMAEFVMKDEVRRTGRENEFEISSAAVSTEQIGNDMYPPAQRKLREKGVPFTRHSAHQITRREFDEADLVVLMDASNRRILSRLIPGSDSSTKTTLLMDFTGTPRDVADPWYTGDFEATYRDVLAGCRAILSRY
ncbi:MAG: low molecular weight protein-tyrosine-phosphatase [Candidatus Cryptobacteroides sp.]|nr:low molecular weight protein-tyrosine-phosphatase [Candidatus Cryptobacteroides sp.]